MNKCSVEGCGAISRTKGYCSAHYQRFWKHGDPLAGRTPEGVPMKFLEDAILNSSRECILFPFAKDRKGYGKVSLDGRMQYAHRIVCERVNGSPNTPKHEAAHLCGNGHLGCINPKHLAWKTRRENELDKNIHGTRARGEFVRNAKLTERQAREIIGLRGAKTLDEVAGMFGVSRTQVWAIQRGDRWSWLGAKRDTE